MSPRVLIAAGFAAGLVAATPAPAQDPTPPAHGSPESFPEVRLRNRRFVPKPGEDPAVASPLEHGVAERVHALAHFQAFPSPKLRKALAARKVDILERVVGTTYVVSLGKGFSFPETPGDKSPAFAVTPITPDDRLGLTKRRFGELLAAQPDPDGRARCLVSFHRDVRPEQATKILRAHTAMFEIYRPPHVWQARLTWARIQALAALDDVRWIAAPPSHGLELVDSARGAVDVDGVQGLVANPSPARYEGLNGSGVRLAFVNDVFDTGHDDFWEHDSDGQRTALRSELTLVGRQHGTWVASLAAGNGFQSDKINSKGMANPGTPYQWRGMAPAATLTAIALDDPGDPLALRRAGSWRADVTNHSYALNLDGTYGLDEEEVDEVVSGRATDATGGSVPRVVGIWGAGNNGIYAPTNYGSLQGYFSVFCAAKNAIVVGATDSLATSPNQVWLRGSRGPTFDGRLKPDVVAPGCKGGSNAFTAAHLNQNDYELSTDCATSWATAIVSGSVALLVQQWRLSFPGNALLPSTVKAVLIQGARDLAETQPYAGSTIDPDTLQSWVVIPVGPDWVSGYGAIDVAASKGVVSERQVAQGSLDGEGTSATFDVTIPEGASRLRVTLAWDDAPGSPLADPASTTLENDLDLEVRGPEGSGAVTYLPWVLTPPTPGDPEFAAAVAAPASRAVDRRNNVEQVEVEAPPAGTWSITVTAYALGSLDGQDFSLAVSHPFVSEDAVPPDSPEGFDRTDDR